MCKMMETGLIGLAPRRARAGYTQQSFADALGIERARLGMWEIGKAWPSAAWLPKMADLLCCCIDDLYERPAEDGGDPSTPPATLGVSHASRASECCAQDDTDIIPGQEG